MTSHPFSYSQAVPSNHDKPHLAVTLARPPALSWLPLIVGLGISLGLSPFARADVAVVVSAQSKLASLSKEQISDLYLGASKDFPGGGAALLLASTGATRDEFYSKVLGKEPSQVKATWSRLVFSGKGTAPREVSDVNELKKLVAAHPSTIAFIDKAAVDASVKVVYTP